jgi:hypothetical protein
MRISTSSHGDPSGPLRPFRDLLRRDSIHGALPVASMERLFEHYGSGREISAGGGPVSG